MSLLPPLDWQAFIVRSRLIRCTLPVLAAFLVLAVGCLVRLPEWQQLQQREHARHKALDEEHEGKATRMQALAQSREALVGAEQLLQDARWRLAAGGSMSDLLDQLAVSGQTHGLHFERLDVLDEVRQAGFVQTPLDVRVVGRYAALRLWLEDWLGQMRLLRAGELHLASADGKPGLVRLRLRVNAFHAQGPVSAPASLALVPARAAALPPALDPFSAWSTRRVREGLAQVPLAQLEMVGSLSRGLEHEALLASAGRLYRVRPGDRLGRDEGVVVHIGPQQVEVRERLFVGGMWRERMTSLTLRKGVDREVKEDHEEADDVAGAGPAADAIAGGYPPSG